MPQSPTTTAFEIVDADGETVGAFQFSSRFAAVQHAEQLLYCGEAGPLYVARVAYEVIRTTEHARLIKKPLFVPTLEAIASRSR